MRRTTIKVPVEMGTDRHPGNEARDFLTECIVDGDLELDAHDFMSIDITDIQMDGQYYDDSDSSWYNIYDVTLEADDRVIKTIEDWHNQFKEPLQ